jgi:hypothetical protein
MAILRERKVCRRERAPRATERLDRLSPEEQANVKVAMRVLRVRYGTMRAVARLMGTSTRTVEAMVGRSGKPTAGLAIRAAKLSRGARGGRAQRGVSEGGKLPDVRAERVTLAGA